MLNPQPLSHMYASYSSSPATSSFTEAIVKVWPFKPSSSSADNTRLHNQGKHLFVKHSEFFLNVCCIIVISKSVCDLQTTEKE